MFAQTKPLCWQRAYVERAESLNGNENCRLYWNLSEHVRAFYFPAWYGDPSLVGSLRAFIELPENLRGRDSSAPRGNNPARAHQQPMNRKCAFTQITRFLTPEGNIVSCLFCTAVTELRGVLVWIPPTPLADVGCVLSFVFIFSLFIVVHHSARTAGKTAWSQVHVQRGDDNCF